LSGPEFVDMVGAYSPALRALALSTPEVRALATGVYAHMPGPQFETPAEVRMLRTLGADVVGMSMGLETIAARQAGASVLGLAVVTNEAAGVTSHIADAGADAVPAVARIIRHVVVSLA
jgi:purine-nucleoside phosphorylase